MISPEHRFWSEGQIYTPSADQPHYDAECNVWDWDQLRMVKLKGIVKLFPAEEDREVPILAQFADLLAPEICTVSLNEDALIYDVSTDTSEDATWFVGYLPYSMLPSFASCKTVHHSQLKELDRLSPGVDLSCYKDEAGATRKVAFKFNVMSKPRRLHMFWSELITLKALPPHPNLLSLDSLVLEDVENRVIGFTTRFVEGGTLENRSIPFRLEWLKQLLALVDFLNLELGIMHQDISPRNLLFDADADKILLFDWDWVAYGSYGLLERRDDVNGVVSTVYELITGDTQYTKIPHWERDITPEQSDRHWRCNRELDADVSVFRDILDKWVAVRTAPDDMDRYLNAPRRLKWEDQPDPPDYDVPFEHGFFPDGSRELITGPRSRKVARSKGQYCFNWQRPPQSRLMKAATMS